MKGVVFSTSFFIVIIAIFINLSNYVHFEHNRAMINNNFKKSLQELAQNHLDENQYDRDSVLDKFEEILKIQLPKDYSYNLKLLGYHEEPFLIRIQLESKSKNSPFSFKLEETIIEKELNEDEVRNN